MRACNCTFLRGLDPGEENEDAWSGNSNSRAAAPLLMIHNDMQWDERTSLDDLILSCEGMM